MESFTEWLAREHRYAAAAMLQSLSRTDLVKERPGFGHAIRASRGSIVASHVLADWNPEPDYFFHWYRDSAVVIDALRLLFEARAAGAEAIRYFADFVRFSLELRHLDGRRLVADREWRSRCAADFLRFVRDDAELERTFGDAVAAETRVNPDGTLDISSWTRPQHDGPPLRALAVIRWARTITLDPTLATAVSELVRADLAFTHRSWREPSYDMWEEEQGLHYHTLCVSAAALEEGAQWLEFEESSQESRGSDAATLASTYRAEAADIRRTLDGFWMPAEGFYRSRILPDGQHSSKLLDIAVIFAAIHAGGRGSSHTPADPRMQATLARLEALFDSLYAINRERPAGRAPAMGRYEGDRYFSGGAYYFSTLGAAEFCFRAAAQTDDRARWLERGDAFLATVRAFTPPGGELSEQFDQNTGAQTSARHLAWSYAAFISCLAARAAVTD